MRKNVRKGITEKKSRESIIYKEGWLSGRKRHGANVLRGLNPFRGSNPLPSAKIWNSNFRPKYGRREAPSLGDIQELASDNVHEGSWEAWDSPKLRFIIELAKATLHEIYVVPEERKERLGVLGQMKSIFANSKNPPEETTTEEEVKE